LRERRLRRRALRLQRLDLALRHFERRLRALDRGLLGLEILDVNRALLSRRPTLIDERLVTSPGDPRELQVRLRLVHLRLVRCDLRLLRGDLRVDVVDAGFCARHLSVGLRERRAVIALVDLGDHTALVDMLVVGNRNRRDVARDLRRDRELPRRNERVVSRFEMRGMIPVDVSRSPGQDQEKEREDGANRMPPQPSLAGFPARFTRLAGLRFALGGRRLGLGGRPLLGLRGRPLSALRRRKQPSRGDPLSRYSVRGSFQEGANRAGRPPAPRVRPFRDRRARRTSSLLPSLRENLPHGKTIRGKI
jgi:hypothetical protein